MTERDISEMITYEKSEEHEHVKKPNGVWKILLTLNYLLYNNNSFNLLTLLALIASKEIKLIPC